MNFHPGERIEFASRQRFHPAPFPEDVVEGIPCFKEVYWESVQSDGLRFVGNCVAFFLVWRQNLQIPSTSYRFFSVAHGYALPGGSGADSHGIDEALRTQESRRRNRFNRVGG